MKQSTETVKIYTSVDGKKFLNYDECQKYESSLFRDEMTAAEVIRKNIEGISLQISRLKVKYAVTPDSFSYAVKNIKIYGCICKKIIEEKDYASLMHPSNFMKYGEALKLLHDNQERLKELKIERKYYQDKLRKLKKSTKKKKKSNGSRHSVHRRSSK